MIAEIAQPVVETPVSPTEPLVAELEARGIFKSFTRRKNTAEILHGIDLVVKPKEFLIISGQSGSGKTTLLNILAGLDSPTNGSVVIRGEDIYRLSGDRRARFRATRFGIVYQQARWLQSLNVVQNVSLPLITVGVSQSKAEAQAVEALKKVGLDNFAESDPLDLSGGEQQRVGIARAIVHDPWLIVADEPTGNLDTHNADLVMQLFSSLTRKEGKAVILVTHNPIYEFYGTHLIEIRDGTVVRESYNQT